MTKNLSEPNDQRSIAQNRFQVKGQRQKPLAGRWITPDCDNTHLMLEPGDCDEPIIQLQNSWQQPWPPLEPFAFRLHMDGSLEMKGHLDASGGAVSGTVAVTFPGANAGEPDYLLANDQYWWTVITTDAGTTFTIALIFVDASSGDLTITWPAI